MLVKSLSFSLIPQIQPIYRSTFENIQGIENCMINEVFYRAFMKSLRFSLTLTIIFREKYNPDSFTGMMEIVSEKCPYTPSRHSFTLLIL
jgi:hypothetical protein